VLLLHKGQELTNVKSETMTTEDKAALEARIKGACADGIT
jgi:L-asparaginase/Glu-tRNA(Gln) amidotransferase subunit D